MLVIWGYFGNRVDFRFYLMDVVVGSYIEAEAPTIMWRQIYVAIIWYGERASVEED